MTTFYGNIFFYIFCMFPIKLELLEKKKLKMFEIGKICVVFGQMLKNGDSIFLFDLFCMFVMKLEHLEIFFIKKIPNVIFSACSSSKYSILRVFFGI